MRAEFEKGIEKEKPAIEKEIAEMLAQEIYEDAKRAYAQIINSWYASYSPKYFNRKMDLKDTGEIVLEGTSVSIYTKSDPLTGHHLGAEGLYDLTIKKGYHGGSTYRGPLYIWSHPTGPAVDLFLHLEQCKAGLNIIIIVLRSIAIIFLTLLFIER